MDKRKRGPGLGGLFPGVEEYRRWPKRAILGRFAFCLLMIMAALAVLDLFGIDPPLWQRIIVGYVVWKASRLLFLLLGFEREREYFLRRRRGDDEDDC